MKRYFVFSIIFLMSFIGIIQAETYKPGDVITYKDIKFYVVEDNGDYLTLLKAKPLTWNEVKKYGKDHVNKYNDPFLNEFNKFYYDSEYATVAYYTSENCRYIKNEDSDLTLVNVDCKVNYNESDIKYIVDGWSNGLLDQNDLKEVSITITYKYYDDDNSEIPISQDFTDNYKARLITNDEVNNFSKSFSNKGLNNMFARLIRRYDFWTMTPCNEDDIGKEKIIYSFQNQSHYNRSWVADQSDTVRPVIHLKKSAKFTSQKQTITKKTINDKEFKVGDVVRYNGMDFYVIKNSDSSDKNLTMIKAVPLTKAEIISLADDWNNKITDLVGSYSDDLTSANYSIGMAIYYNDKDCQSDFNYKNGEYTNVSGCINDYKKSYVKQIVDTWSNENLNGLNLVEDTLGYKARLITVNELTTELYYRARVNTLNQPTKDLDYYAITDDTPFTLGDCWTMTPKEDSNYLIYKIGYGRFSDYAHTYNTSYIGTSYGLYQNNGNTIISQNVASYGSVCPVITISKSESTKVNIPNTLLNNPVFIVVVGIILIVVAIITISLVIKRKCSQ